MKFFYLFFEWSQTCTLSIWLLYFIVIQNTNYEYELRSFSIIHIIVFSIFFDNFNNTRFVLDCTIGGKRYLSGEIFIARNCERMCQCRRTRKFQIITCMPLCPRMRPTTCRKGLVKAIARYVYTFRPLCYCPTTMCVRDRRVIP